MQTLTTYTNNLFYSHQRLVKHSCMLTQPTNDVTSTPCEHHITPLSMSFLPSVNVISTPYECHFYPLLMSFLPPMYTSSTHYQCHLNPLSMSSQPTINVSSTHYQCHSIPISGAEISHQTPLALTINDTKFNYKLPKKDIARDTLIHIISKKAIIIALLMVICVSAFSQNIEINKAIAPYPNNPNSPFFATSIAALGNEYVISARGIDTMNNAGYYNLVFYKVDTSGNISKQIKFTNNEYRYFKYQGSSISTTQDSGFCTLMLTSTNTSYKSTLVRFNSNFDTLWSKDLSLFNQMEDLREVIETKDKDFICIGTKIISNDTSVLLVVKTDSVGNNLWKRNFTMTKNSCGINIKETPDKGFFISGMRENIYHYSNNNYYYDKSPFVIKLDSSGNLIWNHILDGDGKKNLGVASTVTMNGDYLLAYGYCTFVFSPLTGGFSLGKLNVIKYDKGGNILWNKMYDTIKTNYEINKIQILPDSNIVVMGNYVITSNAGYHSESFLLTLNSFGDSLDYKNIYYSQNPQDENFLYDNVLNQYGSITAIGLVKSDTLVPNTKIWLVKTGNLLSTDIKENYYIQKGEIKIFPNPATTQTTITYTQQNKESQLHIYNILGQMLYEEKLPKGSSQTTINTTTFKQGIYKITLGEYSSTLIIE